MALRREDVPARGAVVVAFPRGRATVAARRARMLARRRRALGGVAALAVLGATLLGGGGSAVASRRGAPRSVVLAPGISLWEIAERHAGRGVDTRAYVDAVVGLNRLDAAPRAGTRIELPR